MLVLINKSANKQKFDDDGWECEIIAMTLEVQ